MRPTQNLFTEKAWDAIVRSQDIAKQAQQQIESAHLLMVLLDQDGLASSIVAELGVNELSCAIASRALSTASPRCLGQAHGVLGESIDSRFASEPRPAQ